MHPFRFQKACAWSGIVCMTLFFGAFLSAHFIPPLSPHSSAASIAGHYHRHTNGIRLGGVLMLLSSMFYASFSAVMSAQMERIPGVPRAAVFTQLASGAFACLTFLVPGLLFVVTAFRPDRDPSQTLLLNDLSWVFMVMPWPPFAMQNWTFAYAILADPQERPVFPRWLAYLNIWAPIVFTPGVALAFFKTGVFAWSGLLVLWIPATAFIIQFICNTAMLIKAIDAEQSSARPLTTDPLVSTTG